MKRFCLTILCCFLLSGCIFDPTFNMSNFETFQASLAEMKAKLGNEDKRRLDIALKYLAVENILRAQANVQMASSVSGVADGLTPYAMFVQLRPKIHGKSGVAVIRDLSLKLDTEISRADARLQDGGNIAQLVEVTTTPGYYWKRSGRLEQPAIEFAVFNGGKSAISRAYFRVALTTPNRTIPWARQDYVEVFKGGLEPREKRQLSLHPTGAWSDPQLKYLPDAVLKVEVLNYEDADGEKMVGVDTETLELKRKVRAALG